MQYRNTEITSFFEDDKILGDIANKYFVILQNLKKEKRPPHEQNFIKEFKIQYSMEFSSEEMAELKDFMDNDYTEYARNTMIYDNQNAQNIRV